MCSREIEVYVFLIGMFVLSAHSDGVNDLMLMSRELKVSACEITLGI